MHEKRSRPGWYVVQVIPGTEERMRDAIIKACSEFDDQSHSKHGRGILKSCFCPKFASRKKRKGIWYDTSRPLLPGYVIVDTRDPAKVAQALRGLNDFARVLTSDETYSPLDDSERQWMEAQSSEDDRTIPLSFGAKVGGKLVITSGPLKGHEAMIVRLDRRNCMAHVEFHAGQLTIKTTVGLVIAPNGEASSASPD